MLEFGEASLDPIAFSVEFLVVGAWLCAAGEGGNDGHCTHGLDMGQDGFAVVALVGQHPVGLVPAQQMDGLGAVISLSPGEEEVYRQAQLVGQQMDLGRQTSSGAPQSLVGAPFLRPVAAC